MTTTIAGFVSQDELDAMTDEAFAAFEAECADGQHPAGVTCAMCADEADTDYGLEAGWASRSGGYVSSLWSRSGFGWHDKAASLEARAEALVVGHRMVKAFVNTFATGRGRYTVSFDPSITTAGTDYDGRRIIISPAPVLDNTLSPEEAGVILTAMAVHESSHVRYGTDVATSIRRAFGKRRDYAHPDADTAKGLANILEDVRIERRFAADYPGYAHVFAPASAYVARAGMRRAGVDIIRPDVARPLAFVGQAIRYAEHCDWTGLEAERDWWLGWADRWADKGTPRQRIAAVREGIAHIPEMKQPDPEPADDTADDDTDTEDTDDTTTDPGPSGSGDNDDTGEGDDGDDDGDEPWDTPDYREAERQSEENEAANATPGILGNDPDDDDGDVSDADDMGEDGDDDGADDAQREANDAAQRLANEFAEKAFSACPTEAIAAAAIANGVNANDIDGAEAESLVDAAEHMVTVTVDPMGDGASRAIEVRPAASVPGVRTTVARDGAVSAAVRNAFIRSRTGHTDMERGTKRGRCDNKSLPRVANNDYRLFHRRHAPSPGRYYVRMLVDWSSSMTEGGSYDYRLMRHTGTPLEKVSAIAASIADASRHVDSIRMTVEGWTTANNAFTGDDREAVGGLYEAWRSGQPTERIGDLGRITTGGTPDVYILDHVIRSIAAEARDTGETPVVVMLSDGEGYMRVMTAEAAAEWHRTIPGETWDARAARKVAITSDPASYYTPQAVHDMMDNARRLGVRVVSVAIGPDIHEDVQRAVYGHGNYITWQGSMTATAVPLARLLGRMVAS